ncbi:MAG TPA: hypothetical protein VGA12_12490 [Burkholderiales bacterium]|jgi:hypothetical protein
MTDGTKRIHVAKNWADEIDDLYYDATVRHLRRVFFTQAPERPANTGGPDEQLPGGASVQHESSAGGIPL